MGSGLAPSGAPRNDGAMMLDSVLHGYLPAILGGLRSTVSVAATSLAIACVFGVIGAAAKLSASPTARGVAGTSPR